MAFIPVNPSDGLRRVSASLRSEAPATAQSEPFPQGDPPPATPSRPPPAERVAGIPVNGFDSHWAEYLRICSAHNCTPGPAELYIARLAYHWALFDAVKLLRSLNATP
jgi:hypothetical protein